jgi:hypothetical protein
VEGTERRERRCRCRESGEVWRRAVQCKSMWCDAVRCGAKNPRLNGSSSGEFGRMVEKHDRPMRLPNCGMDLQKYFGAADDAL